MIDLTSQAEGGRTLDWTPPPGAGGSCASALARRHENHPATAEATGLEVDKYDGAAVRRYLEKYLGMYVDASAPSCSGAGAARDPHGQDRSRGRRTGPARWSRSSAACAATTRALAAGAHRHDRRVARRSDAFLFDYRRTLADLMAERALRHGGHGCPRAGSDRLRRGAGGRPSIARRRHGDARACRHPDGRPLATGPRSRPQGRPARGHEGRVVGGAPVRPSWWRPSR